MLQWINNAAIDKQKWDACIDKCEWGNVYALSWFLDLLTDNQWEAMVIGDYEYIMPVPFRKKLGIKYTYRPNFCQQLGVFSFDSNLPKHMVNLFIEELIKNYKHINYPLNHSNSFQNEKNVKMVKRTNFLLYLNDSYEFLYHNFTDGLKKSLKSADKARLEIRYGIEPAQAIALHKRAWNKVVTIPDLDYLNFKKVSEYASGIGLSENIGIFKDSQLLGSCIILKYKNKIYYPFSAVAPEGRKYAAVAVLINNIIKQNSSSTFIFDFEGSDIESVQTFYKKFNPITETYLIIEKTTSILKAVNSFIKKIKSD
ncbi:MAG: hypothetical protein ACKVQB_00960 [Bacteroidia bacterium]